VRPRSRPRTNVRRCGQARRDDEPPRGYPEMTPLLAAVEKLGIDVFAIVERTCTHVIRSAAAIAQHPRYLGCVAAFRQ